MATRSKALSAQKPRSNESLLIRSAESLGRMIGALQRQLDEATRRLSEFDLPVPGSTPASADGAKARKPATRQKRGTSKTATKQVRAGSGRTAATKSAATVRGSGGTARSRSRKATKKLRPR